MLLYRSCSHCPDEQEAGPRVGSGAGGAAGGLGPPSPPPGNSKVTVWGPESPTSQRHRHGGKGLRGRRGAGQTCVRAGCPRSLGRRRGVWKCPWPKRGSDRRVAGSGSQEILSPREQQFRRGGHNGVVGFFAQKFGGVEGPVEQPRDVLHSDISAVRPPCPVLPSKFLGQSDTGGILPIFSASWQAATRCFHTQTSVTGRTTLWCSALPKGLCDKRVVSSPLNVPQSKQPVVFFPLLPSCPEVQSAEHCKVFLGFAQKFGG